MSGRTDLCSIITPAHNAAAFIAHTIRSVQNQTYPHWELLIVDDASKDNTFDIAHEFAEADKRIKVTRHSTSRGPSGARNTALLNASGKFIAFLDSDDLWLPQKLERQTKFMLERRAAISFTEFRRISQEGEQVGRLIRIPETLDYKGLLKNTAIATSTVIVNRETTGPFQLRATYYDDFVLWLSLLKKGFVAHGMHEDLTRYRVVRRSVSRNKLRSALWIWRTYRTIEQLHFTHAAWCFSNYAWHGLKKYREF